MAPSKKRASAFTLVELLVVISIIGVLVSMVVGRGVYRLPWDPIVLASIRYR